MGRLDWVLHRLTPSHERSFRPAQERPLRVLLVGEKRANSLRIARLLQDAGHTVRCASTARAAVAAIDAAAFDVLLVNHDMPDNAADQTVRGIQRARPIPAVALVSSPATIATEELPYAALVERASLASRLLPALAAAASASVKRNSFAAEPVPV